MTKACDLIMISAMYENGGNTTHRFLDGHPELFVYPFESQTGNTQTTSMFTGFFPHRYEWPEFPMGRTPEQYYEMFWDEEMKSRLRVPHVSKFRDAPMDIKESERKEIFVKFLKDNGITRANIMTAYYKSSFDAWKNVQRTGKEKFYVGYNPVVGVHAEAILTDFPTGHVIHVARNPWSAFADTSKRPYPLPLYRYTLSWSVVQLMALTMAERYPDRFHIVRFEDLVADPKATMTKLASKLGIAFDEILTYPSWNGKKMEEVYPWGTVRIPTPEANVATANELTDAQKKEIRSIASPMIKALGYENFKF